MTQEELLAGVVLPIDKPYQWTSFQAVNKVKAAIRNRYGLKKFKIGHAGTLDPLATGLLLVCVGKATKRIEELQAGEKVYSGTMVLGATTPCYDMERAIDRTYPYRHITLDAVQAVLPQFLGDIQQVPPIFSAVKIDGQRAYQYAREGEAPEPTPKQVHIAEFAITAFRPGIEIQNSEFQIHNPQPPSPAPAPLELGTVQDGAPESLLSRPECRTVMERSDINWNLELKTHLYDHPQAVIPPHLPQLDFRIRCGKGTYIRSIARDLGLALDSGAFLSALRREQVGTYTLAQSIPLDQIATHLDH